MLQSYSRTTRINKKLMRELVNHKLTPRAWSDYGSQKKSRAPAAPGTTTEGSSEERKRREKPLGFTIPRSTVYMHLQVYAKLFCQNAVVLQKLHRSWSLDEFNVWHPLVIPKERSPGPWIRWLINNDSDLLNVSKTQSMLNLCMRTSTEGEILQERKCSAAFHISELLFPMTSAYPAQPMMVPRMFVTCLQAVAESEAKGQVWGAASWVRDTTWISHLTGKSFATKYGSLEWSNNYQESTCHRASVVLCSPSGESCERTGTSSVSTCHMRCLHNRPKDIVAAKREANPSVGLLVGRFAAASQAPKSIHDGLGTVAIPATGWPRNT